MSNLLIIALMAGIVFSLRYFGMFTARLDIPDRWERALRFAPIAVLGALVASTLSGQASGEPARYIAAAGAGIIAYTTRRLWACILGGFLLYWGIAIIW